MARYNTFKYGDGTLYGTDPVTTNLLWGVIIDWDQDGYQSGENEANRMVDLKVERGRDYMVKPGGKGFEPLGAGTAVALFDNTDGRYDPYNASSPIYPYVTPGKLVEISVKDGNLGTQYGVMYGVVDDIQPVKVNGQPHARIVVKDGMRWLADQLLPAGYQAGSDYQTIVEWILDAVDWPWTVSADDSALMSDTLNYWWCWQEPALSQLRELEEAEAAVMFHGRDGVFYFYNRDFTHNRTQAVTQSEILKDVATPQPWEVVRNDVTVSAYYKVAENLSSPNDVLFEVISTHLGTDAQIPAGTSITIDATFKYGSYGRLAGTNESILWAILRNSDNADISGSCSMSYQDPVGGGTRFTFTNPTGDNAHLEYLEVNGDVVYNQYTMARNASDSTSQSKYGPRILVLNSFWQANAGDAEDIADWLLAELKDPTMHPVIQFEYRPTYQFYYDLWDRVELTISELGINANYRVGKIEHEWLKPNGQAVRTLMKLEPYFTVFS